MNFWIILLLFPVVLCVKQICPDKTCPGYSTCCQLLDKTYGCCPLKNAVCCDDHIHCCPAKSKCSAGMCIENINATTEVNVELIYDITCTKGNFVCPKDTTCCKNVDSGNYSCCPMENGICCNDGFHCCPSGTVCNVEELRCIGNGFVTPMYDWNKQPTQSPPVEFEKFTLINLGLKRLSNVICPGSTVQCENGYTCCQMHSGVYGCCPYPNATCCKDGLHCCPQYMHCDATSQYCIQGLRNVTALPNIPSQHIVCPDQTLCDSEDTCCKVKDDQYGCCPYPNATCCSDFRHCCPSNNECDVKKKQCIPQLNLTDASDNNINYFEL